MKIIMFLLLAAFYLCHPVFAADKAVSNALLDIEKYEKQFAGKTTASQSSVKRTLKLLGLTRQRLDSSTQQNDPSWQEADKRYKALVSKLNGYLEPNETKPETQSAANVADKPATQSRSAESSGQMISQQRVRIKKLNRDIRSSIDTLDKNGVKPFQDPEYVAKQQAVIDRHQQALSKFGDFSTDADVVTATQSLQEMQNMMAFGRDHAAKELETLGDVQTRLRQLNQAIREIKVPAIPQQPLKQGDISTWLVTMAQQRRNAETLYKPLPDIRNRAYLPRSTLTVEQGGPYDDQDVDRLGRSLQDIVREIDSNLDSFANNLNHGLSFVDQNLAFFASFDPTDRQHQLKHFLAEGCADEVRAALLADEVLVSEAAELSKLLKHDNYQERLDLLQRVKNGKQQYEASYKKSLELIRMPVAATTDAELIRIAKETLDNKRYEYIGDIKRLVINTEKVHREKQTSDVEYDKVDVSLSGDITLSGTETTYSYAWDEFQVATAEPVGEKYYIFYTTLKYFTSGSTTTPLNKWIISGRIQASEIPEANIGLD